MAAASTVAGVSKIVHRSQSVTSPGAEEKTVVADRMEVEIEIEEVVVERAIAAAPSPPPLAWHTVPCAGADASPQAAA